MDYRIYKHDQGFYVVDNANKLVSSLTFIVDASEGIYTEKPLEIGALLQEKAPEFLRFPSLPRCDKEKLPVLERALTVPENVYSAITNEFTKDLSRHHEELFGIRNDRDSYNSFIEFQARITEEQKKRPVLDEYIRLVLNI